jgi:hypothetical protein
MRRAGWLAGIVFAALAVGFVPQGPGGALTVPYASAQSTGMRTVSGMVLDVKSEAVSDATVFLENQQTKTIRSCITPRNGRFYFAQVSMNDNYNLWAQKNKQKSATRIVSSWDTRTDFIIDLTLK